MNGPEPELDELLAPLRDGPVSSSGADSESSRRARLLPAMRSAVRALPQKRARARLIRRAQYGAYAAVALAACFALASRTLLQTEPTAGAHVARAGVQVQSQGEQPLAWLPDGADERVIAGADELSTAGELRADDGARAALVTELGASVEVRPRSRVRIARERAARGAETLSLLEGEIHCRVPPLAKGRSFVVATPSTRVVVHGTEFAVRVGGARGSCVRVREGLVEVQHEAGSVWLGPGSDWGCEDGTSTHEAAAPAERLRPHVARPAGRARTHKGDKSAPAVEPSQSVAAAPAMQGTLAFETALLADALRAEQRGHTDHARSLFQRLIADHPASPLAPEAKAGLARLR